VALSKYHKPRQSDIGTARCPQQQPTSPRRKYASRRATINYLEKKMKLLWSIGSYFALCALGCLLQTLPTIMQAAPVSAKSQQQPPAQEAQHDGQHDFDFNLGTWNTHLRRLQHPLTGSTTWYEMQGTVVVRKVWDGRAQLEEVEAEGPKGHFEDLALFLYNPASRQWSFTFSNVKDGTLSQPSVGEFKNGRGEFYDQETFNGRTILVRIIWSDITPDSHQFEQSFSDDGGKTWETNLVANLTRTKP
jgi:hypothetical protein